MNTCTKYIINNEQITICYSGNLPLTIEYTDGGGYHRTNGPAYQNKFGYKAWWCYGVRHRLDGPAIENPPRGKNEFYINGIELSEEKFNETIKQANRP